MLLLFLALKLCWWSKASWEKKLHDKEHPFLQAHNNSSCWFLKARCIQPWETKEKAMCLCYHLCHVRHMSCVRALPGVDVLYKSDKIPPKTNLHSLLAPNILVVTISVNFNWIVASVACIVWVALSCIGCFVVIWSNCRGLVAWAEWKSQKMAAVRSSKNWSKTLLSISKIFQHNFIQKLILWKCKKLLKFKPNMKILIQMILRYNQTHRFYFSDRKRRLSGLV